MIDAGGGEIAGKNSIQPERYGEEAPALIFGKSYPTNWYADLLVQFPTIFLAVYGIIPVIFTFLSFTFDTTVDRGIEAFQIHDHPTAQALRTRQSVPDEWVERMSQSYKNQAVADRDDNPVRSNPTNRLFMTYEINLQKLVAKFPSRNATGLVANESILTAEALGYIHGIERKVARITNYAVLCWRAPFRGGQDDNVAYTIPHCSPLNSALTYYYVGILQNASLTGYWEFDGINGVIQQPLEKATELLFRNERYRWFMDQSASSVAMRSSMLRSQVTLGAPVADTDGNHYSGTAADNMIDDFVDGFITMMDNHEKHPFIDVTYGGDRIQEVLVLRALARDTVFIVLSVLLVFCVLTWHFHSLILAIFGTLQIFITYPAGFFLYIAITGQTKISLLNALAFYVTLVMATDAMMILFDTFKHSGFMATSGRKNMLTISQRVAYTFRKAGVGISVSSLVSMCCFLVNTASKIPAIRQFSISVVILVLVNWLLMISFFPAAMLFHHFHISKRRRNLQRQKEILIARGDRRRDASFVMFLQQQEELNIKFGLPPYKEIKTYMDGELHNEVDERRKSEGLLAKLGVGQAPIRIANPFGKHKAAEAPVPVDHIPGADMAAGPVENEVDPQAFLDQFADASATIAKGSAVEVVGSDRHNLDVNSVLRINNINCDELCGFDDSRLRFKLMECNARTPAEFRDEQLASLAPEMGIRPLGERAKARLSTVVRMGIVLMYGDGRSLHRPSLAAQKQNEELVKEARASAGPQEQAPTTAVVETDDGDLNADNADERDGPPSPAKNPDAPPKNTRFGFTKRMQDWWADRKAVERKWCCGMCGQRVGETKEEEEARIMSKKVKHEGYGRMELMFFNYWAPAVNFARFGLCILTLILLAVGAILAAQLKPATSSPRFLGENPSEEFDRTVVRFGETGNCDYCSAYFQPISTFPDPDLEAINTCAINVYGGQMMFARVDRCGRCNGDNSCMDCRGVLGGQAAFDTCGQCLEPTDVRWNNCQICRSFTQNNNCSFCRKQVGAAVGFNGPACQTFCHENVNCHPSRGTCNPITGKCECHADFVRGFWQDAWPSITNNSFPRCTVCLNGFRGESCTRECDNATSSGPCRCNNNGRCTGCIFGLGGENCTTRYDEQCDIENGYITTSGCVCFPDFADGGACKGSPQCGLHGIQPPTNSHPGMTGCQCHGAWRGPSCEFCGCYNGGTCNNLGECACPPGWGGEDCQTCTSTCQTNGLCPRPYLPVHYPVVSCRAIFCSDTELATGQATTASCQSCRAVNATNCSSFSGLSACTAADGCVYDHIGQECVSTLPQIWPTVDYYNCTCNGRWRGTACDTCDTSNAVPGVTCNAAGILVGCDGEPANARGQWKVVDNCGTCGGSSKCVGCDGIPGSTKVMDQCGVCGGFNECAEANPGGQLVKPTTTIDLVFGLNLDGSLNEEFDFADATTQGHFQWICAQLMTREDLVKSANSRCIMQQLVGEIYSGTGAFPQTNSTAVARVAYDYMVRSGRSPEIGFSSTNRDDPNLRITWLVFSLRTANIYTYTPEAEQKDHIKLWDIIMRNVNNVNTRGKQGVAFMASEAWVAVYTQRAARQGTTFTLVVGGLVFLAITLAISCSPTVLIVACVVLASDLCVVLGFFWIVGWDLGPIEMISMSLLMGITSEQLTHMVEGYLEYLHASQSHVFARETTRLQAVKGMYQRTGVSILVSGITLSIASCFLYAAKILVFRRVASIMIIILITQMVHALVLFGGGLCAIGPTVSFRNRKTVALFTVIGLLTATTIFLILFFTGAIALI